MKFSVITFLLISFFTGCASEKESGIHPSGLEITEVKPDKWTALTKQNLLHLAQVYDLSPFLFTKDIIIKSDIAPEPVSDPNLTLNTKNSEDPKKILSRLLHGELHWWLLRDKQATSLAMLELKKIYPDAPQTNEYGKDTTYLHLIVCYLELRALEFYVGVKESKQIISALMKQDKLYPWIYYQVLNKDFAIKKIVKKHKLLPPPLN
jgi:hypothetical protein